MAENGLLKKMGCRRFGGATKEISHYFGRGFGGGMTNDSKMQVEPLDQLGTNEIGSQ